MSVFPKLVMRDASGALFFCTFQNDRNAKLVGLVHCLRGYLTVDGKTRVQHCVDGRRRNYRAAELIGRGAQPPSGLRIETELNESTSRLPHYRTR